MGTFSPVPGAAGLVGQNGEPFITALLDTNQDPMKAIIKNATLASSFYTMYMNVKFGQNVKLTALNPIIHGDKTVVNDGKPTTGYVDFVKVTVCAEVSYRQTNQPAAIPYSGKCNVQRIFKLVK